MQPLVTQEQIDTLAAKIKVASEELSALKSAFAKQECPFGVGDTVEIVGNTHKGKRMVVKYVGPAKYTFQGSWRVTGNILKKNGDVGEQVGEFSEWDYKPTMKDKARD